MHLPSKEVDPGNGNKIFLYLNNPRCSHSSKAVGKYLVVVGGDYNIGFTSSIELLDISVPKK